MLIIEDPAVTVKDRIVVKTLFLYINLCVNVKLNSLMSIYIHIIVLLIILNLIPHKRQK